MRPRSAFLWGTCNVSPLSPLAAARVNLQGNVLAAPVLHGLDGLAQGLVTDTAGVLGSGEMRISVSMLQIIILFVTLKDKTR